METQRVTCAIFCMNSWNMFAYVFHSSFLCRMDISNVCTSLSVACIKDRKNTQITDLCRTVTDVVPFTLK